MFRVLFKMFFLYYKNVIKKNNKKYMKINKKYIKIYKKFKNNI